MNEDQVIEDLLFGIVKVQDDHLIGIEEFTTEVLNEGDVKIVLKGIDLSRPSKRFHFMRIFTPLDANLIWKKIHDRKNEE